MVPALALPTTEAPPPPLAQKVTGHRIRLPESLLYSRRHSPLAKAAYGLVDALTPRQGAVGTAKDEFKAGVEWMAGRLGKSTSVLEKALHTLGTAHTGRTDLEPDLPVYLTTRRRGYRATAVRTVTAGIPWVDAPGWTLGDEDGPLVDLADWVQYVVYLHQAGRRKAGWTDLGAREVGQLAGRNKDTIGPALVRLEDAGLVVVARRKGRPDVVLPLAVQMTPEERARLARRLADACGYSDRGVPSDGGSGVPSRDGSGVPSRGGSQRVDTSEKTPLKRHLRAVPRPSDVEYPDLTPLTAHQGAEYDTAEFVTRTGRVGAGRVQNRAVWAFRAQDAERRLARATAQA